MPIKSTQALLTLWATTFIASTIGQHDEDPNLPVNHLPFYYSKPTTSPNNPGAGFPVKCGQEEEATGVNSNFCWGHEDGCDFTKPFSFSYPYPTRFEETLDPHRRLPYFGDIPSTVEEGRALFYSQADFGYVKAFRDSVRPVCTPEPDSDVPTSVGADSSSLECTELFGFCRGRNIFIDFRHLANRTTPITYDMNVLRDGNIRGNCQVDSDFVDGKSRFESALTTWGPEIKHFRQAPSDWRMNREFCDVIVERPTFVMKLDATNNMYHHFCDFFNLYSTLFVNGTPGHHNLFDTDVNILIWRSWYRSSFETAFDAFTHNPLMTLAQYFGQRVCFRDVVFSLLPRMVAGLYYSSPVVPGYRGSGLFRAFSDFMLHRLQIPVVRTQPKADKLRVTFLSRKTTFRRILNEDQIIQAIQANNSDLIVTKVEFTEKTDFKKQLTIIRNTDILVGIHGAGLTHLLFLPKWAAVFEIYHCEDPNCYGELARLAGVEYLTRENPEKLEAKQISATLDEPEFYHKFANYVFDVDEAVRLVNKAAALVIKNLHNLRGSNSHSMEHDEL